MGDDEEEVKKAKPPPKYGDCGKNARNILKRDYLENKIKIGVKSSQKDNFTLETDFAYDTDKESGTFNLGVKYDLKFKNFSLDFSEKFSVPKNVVECEVEFKDLLKKGTSAGVGMEFKPDGGGFGLFGKLGYKDTPVNAALQIDVLPDVVLTPSIVAAFGKNFRAGALLSYDMNMGDFTKYNCLVDIDMTKRALTIGINNLRDFYGNIYVKANDKVEVGMGVEVIDMGAKPTKADVGIKYNLTKSNYFKAKLNRNFDVGLAYRFGPGEAEDISIALSCSIAMANLEKGKHKFGFDFEFAPK